MNANAETLAIIGGVLVVAQVLARVVEGLVLRRGNGHDAMSASDRAFLREIFTDYRLSQEAQMQEHRTIHEGHRVLFHELIGRQERANAHLERLVSLREWSTRAQPGGKP